MCLIAFLEELPGSLVSKVGWNFLGFNVFNDLLEATVLHDEFDGSGWPNAFECVAIVATR
jgi:hypothetical protein